MKTIDKKFSSMRTFTVGKYEVCVFPNAWIEDKQACRAIKIDEESDTELKRRFTQALLEMIPADKDAEDALTLWYFACRENVEFTRIGVRKIGQTHGVMMDTPLTVGSGERYVSHGWVDIGCLLDFRDKFSEKDNEYLECVEAEVERIGKGYTCNFRYRGENIHHINGANHFCFSLDGEKVHPLTVGGSRFCYPSDFTKDEFIEKLPTILLTDEECNAAYRGIWNEMTK